MAMIMSIPTSIVMRTFGLGKRVPFVFPTSPDCVVMPAFSSLELAAKFCVAANDPSLSPTCMSLAQLGDQMRNWLETEPDGGLKLLAVNVTSAAPERFRAATMADALKSIQHSGDTVETRIYNFVEVAPPPADVEP
jgi:hypothetical protein